MQLVLVNKAQACWGLGRGQGGCPIAKVHLLSQRGALSRCVLRIEVAGMVDGNCCFRFLIPPDVLISSSVRGHLAKASR